jgi:hypothetical protein
MQADYYRGFLEQLRSELESDLARHVRHLTECTATGEVASIGLVRQTIRVAEGEMRVIETMLGALNRRFSDDVKCRA